MSDYMFMLDNHLSAEQAKAVAAVRDAAEQTHVNVFLTGGAMRDTMGGFPIRDLDFTVEGPAVKLAKTVAQKAHAEITSTDEVRRSAEMIFPGGVSASISMARQEHYPRPGAKPHIQPATIHEDLHGRDFTVNAIALSLSQASRGLLLDPTNGLGDLSRKELRAVGNYSLYDDPSRLLRLVRLRIRLGFTVDERTTAQYRNAREAKLETKIPAAVLREELRQIALDPVAGDILKALEEEQMLAIFSPALSGSKLNNSGFQRLHKARQVVPAGLGLPIDFHTLFLYTLFEELSPKERGQLVQNVSLAKSELDAVLKLESKAAKVEKQIAAAKLPRPSALYALLNKVPGEILLFLLMHSGQRLVLDRTKNYLQKYLPAAQEITPEQVIERGAQPGTAKFAKLHQEMIAARLDARPKKIVVEQPPPPPPPPGRRMSSFGR